ncbi:hypothetical protein [Streptomyces europaeiscabiei]|uniref:hypothetical protein n=1 Tax=Streptomyces europaeiscabiei TaxID=146819 RepID=UPI000765AC61|nr:hypothetical protein [Streptomyces europaeiscabiei]MDX3673346.1 hypothetical protein [Streptomyces europaeiscabiei]MDX3716139.1 hypothetical protein [Streptomyces europaeiscabiei]MDX3839628.1 hypothetical protein [Streptomyces europaeiscabiei]MDX3847850.1 hypothetical protein [Streptomyces europaeiscabiei]MDX3867054.1 hypothetical protein [Streptomyces europaeiscabiei]
MGDKPPKLTASGNDAISVSTVASASVFPIREITSTSGRFGMPHAFVISVCIATAAILAPSDLEIGEVLLLLAGAGAIGVALVAVAGTGGRSAGRIGRLMRAYSTSGN